MYLRSLILPLAAGALLLLNSSFAKSGCDSEATYKSALTKIKDFNLIKDYRIYLKRQRKSDDPQPAVYFPITMNRGEKYRFYCLENPEFTGKLVVTIYNNMKREFMVATTYNKSSNSKYEAIEFKSSTTGNFCIAFTVMNGQESCGVGISSFKKE
ncbi:MAG: hypothetical protein ACRC3B_04620 [Bacteroidia bacterium]